MSMGTINSGRCTEMSVSKDSTVELVCPRLSDSKDVAKTIYVKGTIGRACSKLGGGFVSSMTLGVFLVTPTDITLNPTGNEALMKERCPPRENIFSFGKRAFSWATPCVTVSIPEDNGNAWQYMVIHGYTGQ